MPDGGGGLIPLNASNAMLIVCSAHMQSVSLGELAQQLVPKRASTQSLKTESQHA